MGWWESDFGEVYSGAPRKLPASSLLAPRVALGVIRGSLNWGPEVESFFVQPLDVGFQLCIFPGSLDLSLHPPWGVQGRGICGQEKEYQLGWKLVFEV